MQEAEELGYTVELVPYCETPASPGILGARAGVCIPHLRRILVRDVLDEADRVTVLGHELEHARGAGQELDEQPRPLLNFEKKARRDA